MWAKEGLANVMRRMGHAEWADRLVRRGDRRRAGDGTTTRKTSGSSSAGANSGSGGTTTRFVTLREALGCDGRWIAVRFDLALALMCWATEAGRSSSTRVGCTRR